MLELILEVSVAEFQIRLQYISKQHTGAENALLLGIFDLCAANTRIFSYVTWSKSGGRQDGVHTRLKIWPKWRHWLDAIRFLNLEQTRLKS